MFGRWYRIFGISSKMYEEMRGTFDENIAAYKDESGEVHISAYLTIFEALKLKRQIKSWNKEHERRLYLVKM